MRLDPGPRLVRDLVPPLTREEVEEAARMLREKRLALVITMDERTELMERYAFTVAEIEAMFHVADS